MIPLRKPFLLLAVIAVAFAFVIEAFSPSIENAGHGLAALAIFDALLLLTLGLIAAPMVVSQEAVGRLQGVLSFVVACLTMGLATTALFEAAVLLYLKIVLLALVIPYALIWSDFPVDVAGGISAVLLLLKVAAAVCLVLAHASFLTNKGLVALLGFSVGLTMLVSFLLTSPPPLLASIGDTIASIVVLIVALLWAVVFALASLPAVKKAING